MRTLNIIQIFRDNNNKIVRYTVQDNLGIVENIKPQDLKNQIRQKLVTVNNFKLTSNNRLIQTDKHVNSVINLPSNTKTDSYLLMNKDKVVAYIDILFDTHLINGKLPYGYDNARDWISSKAKFSCAKNVKEFFRQIGINNTNDFINITHCVSLQDTFWIKDVNSKLTWNQVSPFRNDYSKVISTYALEGQIIGKDKNYFSPVISTDGSFLHTWKFYKYGDIKFIKAGSKYTLGGSNSGREPYSEYYASIVADYLKFYHVKYKLRYHKRVDGRTDVVTECTCYTNEIEGSVTAHTLGLNSYEAIIEYCKKLNSKSFKTIIDMLFLDCLLMNTDRHFSNIEFLVNNDTLQVISIAPIFDNNYSLLPRFIEGYDIFNETEYLARDNRTFDELYKLVKQYKNYNAELISLKSLFLLKPDKVYIKDERLKFLNRFLQMRVDKLLKL